MYARTFGWSVVLGVVLLAPVTAGAGQGGASERVTFAKDIAPILQRSCQNCHRPDALARGSMEPSSRSGSSSCRGVRSAR